MLVLNKLCFVLSASSRLSGKRAVAKTAAAAAAGSFSPTCCRMSSSDPASAAAAAEWPHPAAFNALSHSSRSKIYCDYGDEGSMAWKPHEEPPKHPLPPFTAETALKKTKAAEAAWNTRDPAKVAAAYSPDTVWRNRDEIFAGREEVQAFLTRKWSKEQGYRLKKHLWSFEGNRISARFEYEWYDEKGQWYRTHGNEHWEFDDLGYMRWRDMSANDIPIDENERRLTA
ncbi:unnamed protein product [Ectocarpus sp. 6 AP-2014]